MLLGFIVSKHCIEANPEKITAITRMGPIQDEGGTADHGMPRGSLPFHITPQRTRYLPLSAPEENRPVYVDKLKQVLMKAPILVPSVERELLVLYITATTQVISAALVVEREVARHAVKM
jgi:hypothetical protein